MQYVRVKQQATPTALEALMVLKLLMALEVMTR